MRVDTRLLAVRDHLLALDVATAVLPADDRPRARGGHRAQHLDLLVPHRLRGEVDRRLHRGQREQLQQVVLEDVPDRAGPLVVAGPALDPHRLGHGDLHVVDQLPVPERLEDPVREPECHEVLDGLLAEVVVDAEDLVLGEPAPDRGCQLASGREVVAEGLLDDHARPALPLAALPDLADHDRKRLRGDRQVVQSVAARAAGPVELVEHVADTVLARVVREVGRDITHTRCEFLEHVGAGRGRARTPSPPSASSRRTACSTPRSGRRRPRRTAPGGAAGRPTSRAPGRASASSGRPRRRTRRARRDPACAGCQGRLRAGSPCACER